MPVTPQRSQTADVADNDGRSADASNPVHEIADQLYRLLNAIHVCHRAASKAQHDAADTAWQSITVPFWKVHRLPSEALRGIADPALVWLRKNGVSDQEGVAAIEAAAQWVVNLAKHQPCALPRLYANPADAESIWRAQEQLLLNGNSVLDALRRVAALAGVEWKWDRRLAWDVPATAPSASEIVARQRAQLQSEAERAVREAEASRRHQELVNAFRSIRYCTPDELPAGADWYAAIADRMVALAKLLAERGQLEELICKVADVGGIEREVERDARLYIAHLLREAAAGRTPEIAGQLQEAFELPFAGRVNEWLRCELERLYFGAYPLTASVDGIVWPVLRPHEHEDNPLATFLEACDAAAIGLARRGPTANGSIDFGNVVRQFWRQVEELAVRLRVTAPPPPGQVLNERDALREVGRAHEWAHGLESATATEIGDENDDSPGGQPSFHMLALKLLGIIYLPLVGRHRGP
jgi:hypothetical protein